MDESVKNSYQSLPPLERARLFKHLNENGISSSQIARELGKSLAYVSNTIRLLKLPLLVQEGLISNTISEGHARALLSLKDEQSILTIYREVLVKNANVRETEELVRKAFVPMQEGTS